MDEFEGAIKDPYSLHKYLYANSDPVDGSDPTGHFTLVEALNVTLAVSIAGSLISTGLSLAFRGFGLKEEAQRLDGLARMFNGVAFMASAYRWGFIGGGVLAAAAFTAGYDELAVGSQQLILGGHPASPIEGFLMRNGFPTTAKYIGVAKLILSFGPRTFGLARDAIKKVIELRFQLGPIANALKDFWRIDRANMPLTNDSFKLLDGFEGLAKAQEFERLKAAGQIQIDWVRCCTMGGDLAKTGPTEASEALTDIARFLSELYTSVLPN